MERRYVSSSTISSVGYDPDTRTLELRFVSGGTYRYSNVPENRYTGLVNSSSKGAYFNSYIKDRYRCRKVR